MVDTLRSCGVSALAWRTLPATCFKFSQSLNLIVAVAIAACQALEAGERFQER
jgi:hypothetical protein